MKQRRASGLSSLPPANSYARVEQNAPAQTGNRGTQVERRGAAGASETPLLDAAEGGADHEVGGARVALVFGCGYDGHPEFLADADAAAAHYRAQGFDTQVVKDPDEKALKSWLAFGGQGVGSGGELAVYFAGFGGHEQVTVGSLVPAGWSQLVAMSVRPFFEAVGMAGRAGAATTLVLDAMIGEDKQFRREWQDLHHQLDAERSSGASTGTAASGGASDQNSYTQALLDLAAKAPEVPLDELLGVAASRSGNRGGRAKLGEKGETPTRKRALVLGNGAYINHGQLPGAIRDASGMAGMLEGRGYEVDHRQNLTGAALYDALESFEEGARPGDDAVIYFAGHGLAGDLVGIDREQVGRGVVQRVRDGLARVGGSATLVVDACESDALHQVRGQENLERPELKGRVGLAARRDSAKTGLYVLSLAFDALDKALANVESGNPFHFEPVWLASKRAIEAEHASMQVDAIDGLAGIPSYRPPDLSRELPLRTAVLNLGASVYQFREAASNGVEEAVVLGLRSAGEAVETVAGVEAPFLDDLDGLGHSADERTGKAPAVKRVFVAAKATALASRQVYAEELAAGDDGSFDLAAAKRQLKRS